MSTLSHYRPVMWSLRGKIGIPIDLQENRKSSLVLDTLFDFSFEEEEDGYPL